MLVNGFAIAIEQADFDDSHLQTMYIGRPQDNRSISLA